MHMNCCWPLIIPVSRWLSAFLSINMRNLPQHVKYEICSRLWNCLRTEPRLHTCRNADVCVFMGVKTRQQGGVRKELTKLMYPRSPVASSPVHSYGGFIRSLRSCRIMSRCSSSFQVEYILKCSNVDAVQIPKFTKCVTSQWQSWSADFVALIVPSCLIFGEIPFKTRCAWAAWREFLFH